MTQDEFPAELVGRIAADLNLGSRYDAQRIVIAVLRASKHAELVAALKAALPYVVYAIQNDPEAPWMRGLVEPAEAVRRKIDAAIADAIAARAEPKGERG